jgi:hypothetical protein
MKPSAPLLLKAALVLFILLNLFLVLKLKGTTNVSRNEGKGAEMKAEMLLKNIYIQMESEGAVVNGHLQLESESGEISRLAELVSGKTLLFLRYSHLHCNLCVDHSLAYLKSVADSIGHENIVVLASYRTMRDLSLFKRVNQIKFPVYRIPENSTGIPADKYGLPYLFVTDESMVIRNIHIPDKDVPELNRIFLATVPGLFRTIK